MRVRIKVADLSLNQWAWLQENLPASYEIPEHAVRVCVELELTGQTNPIHREMSVRKFMFLMSTLDRVDLAKAVLTPDALPDHLEAERNAADPARCDHGARVARSEPSAFDGATIKTYEDGCQLYGPYRNDDQELGSTGPSYGAGPGEER